MDKSQEAHKSVENGMKTQLENVLAGKIAKLPPIDSRTIRIFISSTFAGEISNSCDVL